MNRYKPNYNKAFTLVELMIAMGFVSALLLAVAMTVIQVGNIYNRGLTLKTVNMASNAIADDLRKTISNSVNFDPAVGNGRYIEYKSGTVVIGGRLCTGRYTYAWNRADYVTRAAPAMRKNYYSSSTDKYLYLVKIDDPSQYYCATPAASIQDSVSTELLNKSDSTSVNNSNLLLAIYGFSVSRLTTDGSTDQSLINVQIVLGTADSTAATSVTNPQCLTSGSNANFSFCSFSQLNLVIRTGNIASEGS